MWKFSDIHQVREKWYDFWKDSDNFVSGLRYHEQERGPCGKPISSRVMYFNFLLSPEIGLSKVVSVVQLMILGDQYLSVFFLKDLRRLYRDRLNYLGADEDMIKNVKVTGLKEQLLGKIPRLHIQENRKIVILTVKEDVGRATVEFSQNTWHDEEITKSCENCTYISNYQEKIEGDLSKQHQKLSVPPHLLNLVSLVLDGETTTENASTNAETAATNLAQLLQFNAVKAKTRCDGLLRHSRSPINPLSDKNWTPCSC